MDKYDYIAIFCKNIKLLRQTYKLSKKSMAKRLGICLNSLNRLEQGEMPHITLDIFFNIEKEFGLDMSQMLTPFEQQSNIISDQ